jgi:5-methylcytosine-specific restriction endonuclease McrA
MANGVPKSLRRFLRTGTAKCWYCGDRADTGDHAIPRSRGGPDGVLNVIPACRPCNEDKGNMNVEEFRLYRMARHLVATAPAYPVCNILSMLPSYDFYGEQHV